MGMTKEGYSMGYADIGRRVFEKEISVLQEVKDQLDEGTFEAILHELVNCRGKVVVIGMGKSGHVAKKMAASMASLGTCAISLHPGECMHGDLGMIQKNDVVILISYSGESEEILRIIPGIKMIGAKILGITCNGESSLAAACRHVQVMKNVREACHLGLAPTSSTTAVMVYGDALAVAASVIKQFDKNDFGRFHPAGSLGKKLITRAVDLMHPLSSCIEPDASLFDALQAMIETDTDLITVVDSRRKLNGIVTNGDLKSAMQENADIMNAGIEKIIHKYPYFVDDSAMAVEALEIMEEKHVHALPVVRDNIPVGVIEKRDILKYGIYI